MTASRKIAFLSVGRSDFGRYRPILRALAGNPGVHFRLLASGAHWAKEFGETWREIEANDFVVAPGLEMTLASDTPASVGKAIGLGTLALAQDFAQNTPDLLVLLGDRYEMLCGANAALGFNLPIVHIHGGAVTEGAIDELVRHALTKMSHIHLVSTDVYAARVRQMGEEAWRVHTVGAPGLDELAAAAKHSRADLARTFGLAPDKPWLLVNFHPVTIQPRETQAQIESLLDALAHFALPTVITYPNADVGSGTVIAAIEAFAARNPGWARIVRHAGLETYASLMAAVAAMVGNSSSGLVEAPAFMLPAVNIGIRQEGKIKAANVIDCDHEKTAIVASIDRALSDRFRRDLRGLVNPYGDGKSGPRIAGILKSVSIDQRLLRKVFVSP